MTVAFDRYAFIPFIFDESFALILTVHSAPGRTAVLALAPLSGSVQYPSLPGRYPDFIKGKSFTVRCECLCGVVCMTSAPHPNGCEFDPPKEQILFSPLFPPFWP